MNKSQRAVGLENGLVQESEFYSVNKWNRRKIGRKSI